MTLSLALATSTMVIAGSYAGRILRLPQLQILDAVIGTIAASGASTIRTIHGILPDSLYPEGWLIPKGRLS